MINAIDIDTSYTFTEPKPIVRFIEQNATPTSFYYTNYSIPTGNFYEIDYVGELVNNSLEFINNMPVLPIDNEMDDYVDDLINTAYAQAEIVPLT